MVVFIDNVVLGTVQMHVKRGVMKEIADLVCSTFTEEEILTAKTDLEKQPGYCGCSPYKL